MAPGNCQLRPASPGLDERTGSRFPFVRLCIAYLGLALLCGGCSSATGGSGSPTSPVVAPTTPTPSATISPSPKPLVTAIHVYQPWTLDGGLAEIGRAHV